MIMVDDMMGLEKGNSCLRKKRVEGTRRRGEERTFYTAPNQPTRRGLSFSQSIVFEILSCLRMYLWLVTSMRNLIYSRPLLCSHLSLSFFWMFSR